jgi:hypothetical protein
MKKLYVVLAVLCLAQLIVAAPHKREWYNGQYVGPDPDKRNILEGPDKRDILEGPDKRDILEGPDKRAFFGYGDWYQA